MGWSAATVVPAIALALALQVVAPSASSDPQLDLASIPNAVIQRTDVQGRSTSGYYPERAFTTHINGLAVISCKVEANGNLSGCSLVYEFPQCYPFGTAALKLAENGGLRAPNEVVRIDQGLKVELKVPFVMFPHADQGAAC